ncbi:MAG: oligosaccharide flippase family protein [Clostridiales bacterium]|nr:oligosaccharide flippase family protein [Clostridiales bacterium]
MRTVGVVFNAYVSDHIGESGMGLFTLVMSVYTFAVTFATSGINLAATRLTAEAMGHGNEREIRDAMKRCIVYSLFFGTVGGIGLFGGSHFFGAVLMGDARTVPSLRLLAFGLPFLSISSALNGYFTAVRRVAKYAVCQFFEQICKIIFTMFGFSLFLPMGLEYGCLALVGASMISECLSFLLALLLYLIDLARHNHRSGNRQKGLTKKLCGIALPVAVSAYFRSGLVTAEHMLIPWGLKRSGATSDAALASYGVIQGMVLPVVLYPSAFLNAFSSLLVPEFAEEIASGKRRRTEHIATKAIGATLLFSIGVAGIMMSYADVLGQLIYKSAESGFYIRVLSALVPVMYLDGIVDGMLKGMGYQFYSMVVNIIDALLSLILVFILVPRMGVIGYVITIFVGEIVNYALSISKLLVHMKVDLKLKDRVLKPMLSVVGATTLGHILFSFVEVHPWLQMAACLCMYIILLFCTFSISKADIAWIKGIICKKGGKVQLRHRLHRQRDVYQSLHF